MRYLLVVLEDETTVEPDPDIFEFEDPPDPRNVAACLDGILKACVPEKLGKRAVIEIPPDHFTEFEDKEWDFRVGFDFVVQGGLE